LRRHSCSIRWLGSH